MYSEYHRLQDDVIRRAGACPSHRFEGRGIVICAGGPRLFTCAWVLVRVLRDVLHTSLPIQVWHRGPSEMDPVMRALLVGLGVEVVDAFAVASHLPPPQGWALKPFAMLHTRFREVLLIDADNVPTMDPAALFETEPYRETGAVFWPDLKPIPPGSAIWDICRVPYRDEPSFESGQIVLDKARCWTPLLLAMHFNERADFYYRHIHGDKDTFHMAWRLLAIPYSLAPHPPRLLLNEPSDPLFVYRSFVLGQHGFDGRVLFQHRNTPKFILFGKNPRYPEFRFEDECRAFLDELALLWNGRVATLDLPLPRVAARGLSRWFRYVRISQDEQFIELLPDQRIGFGNSDRARRWRRVSEGGASILELFSDEFLVCRVTRQEDGIWRGRWLFYERMPVELIPWEPAALPASLRASSKC